MKPVKCTLSKILIFILMLVGAPSIALSTEDSSKDNETSQERKRDHRHQGVANMLIGFGGYIVAPYEKNDPIKACSDIDSKDGGDPVCSGRSGTHMDLLGGFGVTSGMEIFAMLRLGLEDQARARPQNRMLGAGIKVYSPHDGFFKIGFGVAALFDFSKRQVDTYDFMIHVPALAQFDINPWFAPYIQVSPNISFVTEFRMEILAGIGIQGRFI